MKNMKSLVILDNNKGGATIALFCRISNNLLVSLTLLLKLNDTFEDGPLT